MEITIFCRKTHYKLPFSIAMLVYQGVIPFFTCNILQFVDDNRHQRVDEIPTVPLWIPYDSPKQASKKNKFFPDIFRIPLFSTSILSAKNNKQSFPSTLPRNLHGSPNFASNFPYEIPWFLRCQGASRRASTRGSPAQHPRSQDLPGIAIEQGTHTMNYYDISGDISKLWWYFIDIS